jgi:prophage regulatory protein
MLSEEPSTHETILRLQTVLSRTGLSKSLIYELIAKDQFPKPIQLGMRAVGWIGSEVDSWIATRIRISRHN